MDAMKRLLIEAAADEGLAFGLRVVSMEAGGPGALGDPVQVYKVSVADGKEELVRGLEFLPVQTRALKRILAAGSDRAVFNAVDGVVKSIVAPAVLFEELELSKLEHEFNKLPILPAPAVRSADPGAKRG